MEGRGEGGRKILLCLSSDTSREFFPQNTRAQFSNKLPRPVINREFKKFTASIISLGLNRRELVTRHVRVHLKELKGQVEGQGFTHVLGRVNYITQGRSEEDGGEEEEEDGGDEEGGEEEKED